MQNPKDFPDYPKDTYPEEYSVVTCYQELRTYQEKPRPPYQEQPYQEPTRIHQESPVRNHQEPRQPYQEPYRQSYQDPPREPNRQSYETQNSRLAYADNPSRQHLQAQHTTQYEEPKVRLSHQHHKRHISNDCESISIREVNTYSTNKPRDSREPFETDIPSIPKPRHPHPADEPTVLTKFNYLPNEDIQQVKREKLTRPSHDSRDLKPNMQNTHNPLSKTSIGFNDVDLRESFNQEPAGMLDILEDMDGLGLTDTVDNWKGRDKRNMTMQGFKPKAAYGYKEPIHLGGSQRIPRENFDVRGIDYQREPQYQEPVRNTSPYKERIVPYREQPSPYPDQQVFRQQYSDSRDVQSYSEQPGFRKQYSDSRDLSSYAGQPQYTRTSSIREPPVYAEQPVYREPPQGYREQPKYYDGEIQHRRQNSGYREQQYRDAPQRGPSKYSETPVYSQPDPPQRGPSKYSEAQVHSQPDPKPYKPQESMYRKSSWNEEPQAQSLKAPSTVATGESNADWDNWDE